MVRTPFIHTQILIMAKKRKKKASHRRRRKVGAIHPAIMQIATKAAGVVVGAVGASFVNSGIKKLIPKAPAFTGGALAAVAGIGVPYFVKGPFFEGVGNGMVAAGGLFVLNETFLSIPGVSGLPMMPGKGFVNQTVGRSPMRRVNGLDNLKTVGALIDN